MLQECMCLPIVIIVVHMRLEFCRAGRILGKVGIVNQHLLYVCTLLWSVSFLVHLIAAGTGQNCNCVCSLHQPSLSLPLFGTQLDCRFDLLLSMVRPLSTTTYIARPLILPKIHLFQKRSTHCLHGYAL